MRTILEILRSPFKTQPKKYDQKKFKHSEDQETHVPAKPILRETHPSHYSPFLIQSTQALNAYIQSINEFFEPFEAEIPEEDKAELEKLIQLSFEDLQERAGSNDLD